MKKLFVILAAVALVWAFAAPASAVDWNFYGSARMATFWTSTETGDGSVSKSEDSELNWTWQNNSRIGARVKGETVSGNFEVAMAADGGSDVSVGTRRLGAHWDFGAGTLSIEKGYTSFNQFLSGQIGRVDAGLLGRGFMYAGRPGFIGLKFGGFGIQFIDIEDDDDLGTGGDVDTIFPKVEANWGMAFDAFSFQLRGGYQYYCIDKVGPTASQDFDVTSVGLGAEGSFNFGPAYIRAGLSWAQNGNQARWTAGAGTLDAAGTDLDDTDTTQGGLVVGFKMSDMVSFEGGFGYRVDDFDQTGTDDTTQWEFYLNSVVGLAPGVYIIPEFGYADVDTSTQATSSTDWYLGAKWQMDF
jgi:hypothetical protein